MQKWVAVTLLILLAITAMVFGLLFAETAITIILANVVFGFAVTRIFNLTSGLTRISFEHAWNRAIRENPDLRAMTAEEQAVWKQKMNRILFRKGILLKFGSALVTSVIIALLWWIAIPELTWISWGFLGLVIGSLGWYLLPVRQ